MDTSRDAVLSVHIHRGIFLSFKGDKIQKNQRTDTEPRKRQDEDSRLLGGASAARIQQTGDPGHVFLE